MVEKASLFQIPLMPDLVETTIPMDIIDSICAWNAARYKQEFNFELTINLLFEEVAEIQQGVMDGNLVEVLDGCGDVAYAAIGAMWKAGLDSRQISNMLEHAKQNVAYLMIVPDMIKMLLTQPSALYLAVIVNSVMQVAAAQLSSYEAASAVLYAICKSNNTKIAAKTASDAKYSLDKGPAYIPPTKAIEAIIKERINGLS